jgi:hypothetical protein
MSGDRCTTIRLDLRDLARAAEDPKLAALLRDGWRPIAHIALSEDDGAPSLVIVLAPPEAKPIVQPAISPLADRLAFVAFLLSGAGVALGLGLLLSRLLA